MYLGKLYTKQELEIPLREMEGVPEDEPATIKIRLLTNGEQRRVGEAAIEHSYEPNADGELKPKIEWRTRQSREALFMKAVTGWSNFFEDKECTKPLVFNEPNKRRLIDLWPELCDFVNDRHGKMAREAEAAREEEEKN